MIHTPVRASPYAAKVPSSRPKNFVLPPCRVCGGKAAGFHYGANTCEACKGFFHRSLRRKEDYKCIGVGSGCDVRPGKQRSCPRCRFQKCLDAGMSRAAIKTGRYTYVKRNQDNLEVQNLQRMSRQQLYLQHHQRFPFGHSSTSSTTSSFYFQPPSITAPQYDPSDLPPFFGNVECPDLTTPPPIQPEYRKQDIGHESCVQTQTDKTTLQRRHDFSRYHFRFGAEAAKSPLPLSSPSSSGSSSTSVEVSDSDSMNLSMENFEILDFLDLTDNTISQVPALPCGKSKGHEALKSTSAGLQQQSGGEDVVNCMLTNSADDKYPNEQYRSPIIVPNSPDSTTFKPYLTSGTAWEVNEKKGAVEPYYTEGVSSTQYNTSSSTVLNGGRDGHCASNGFYCDFVPPHGGAHY